MQIKNEKPPIWENACAAFQINPKNTIFTYGDIIYNPGGKTLSEDVIAHETVHIQQQSVDGPDLWWGKYLRDPEFRIQQEVRAYAAQFAFLISKYKDKNQRVRILMDLAQLLSGPLYANAISHTEAMMLIQQCSGFSILK